MVFIFKDIYSKKKMFLNCLHRKTIYTRDTNKFGTYNNV